MLKGFYKTLLSISFVVYSTCSYAADKVALIIGNSEYKSVADNLKNPVNDAKSLQKVLQAAGYQTNLVLNANLDTMLSSLDKAKEQVDAGGTLVFYYAGHGVQADNQNFLVPTNAQLSNKDRIAREAVSLQEIIEKLQTSSAAAKILIIDACRNDPFPKTYRSGTRGLVRMQPPARGLMVMYAASPGEVAQDGKGRNGTFTGALLDELNQPNQRLTDLMDNVVDKVRVATGGQQNPYYEGTGLSKLVLVGQDKNSSTAIATANVQPSSSLGGEDIFWQSIISSPDIEDFQEYLNRYPNGSYVYLAEKKIKQIELANESQAWQRVLTNFKESILEDFIKEFPNSTHIIDAQKKLDVLKKTNNIVEKKESVEPCKSQIDCSSVVLQDCPDCPILSYISNGSYMMGANIDEGYSDERPSHSINLKKPFWVGRYEVTFKQWDICAQDKGCNNYMPNDEGWGRDFRPVINVNWYDAQAYVQWLSSKTGRKYRLLSEAEWEYIARAGTNTVFYSGICLSNNDANFNSTVKYNNCSLQNTNINQTIPVGSLKANPWGVYDILGNVREWVEDCFHDNYIAAPTNGSPWITDCSGAERKVLRGGSWRDTTMVLRASNRLRNFPDNRNNFTGFRVVREVD